MRVLIVVAHPNPNSLTHRLAAQLAQEVATSGRDHTIEVADLAREGFDPRFTAGDHAAHARDAQTSAAVRAEQARIDRCDALVLIYPVYWWSFPALLKGWIDRVFANGWAYDESPQVGLVKKLGRLPVHLIAIGGADQRTYARHGYFGAMKLQIDHGIFGYCGAPVTTSELLLDTDLEHHDRLAQSVAARIVGHRGSMTHDAA